MKNIIWLIMAFLHLYTFVAFANEAKNYTAIYSGDAYHINKNGAEIYSFPTTPAKYRFEVLNDDRLLAIFEFERGNALIILIDNSTSKIIDTLELKQFEGLSKSESNQLLGGENRYMFLEPGSPMWPQVFSISNDGFVKEEIGEFPEYIIKALIKTIEYVEEISDTCEHNLESCYYKVEYSKAVKQMRELADLLVL